MSDALSKFISGLQTLDANNLAAPQNAAALKKFQSLDSNTQKAVLNDLTAAHGTTFDELNGLSEADKTRVTDNLKNGRGTFDGVNRQQQAEAPKSFNEKWLAAAEAARSDHSSQQEAYASSHADFAKQHGAEAARNRHGYQNPAREAQLSRVAAIQKEAALSGRTFGDVADEFVRAGR